MAEANVTGTAVEQVLSVMGWVFERCAIPRLAPARNLYSTHIGYQVCSQTMETLTDRH